MKRFAYGTAFASILLGFSLLAVELLVRILGIAPPLSGQVAGLVSDSLIPFKHAPHSVSRGRSESDEFDFEYRHNALGFRDLDRGTTKPPDVRRVVALGDSFTYGEGTR